MGLTVKGLNEAGQMATIALRGEEVRSAEEAAAIVRAYRDVFARIDDMPRLCSPGEYEFQKVAGYVASGVLRRFVRVGRPHAT